MTETHATIRGSIAQISGMLRQSALTGDTSHDDVLLQVTEDEVRILAKRPGEVVLTYCTFAHDWFDNVNLVRDAHEVGYGNEGDQSMDVVAEALLDVENTVNYLDLAGEEGTVELEFMGSTDRRLASRVKFDGAIETGVRLPGSQEALSKVPFFMVDRWTDDERYTDSTGEKVMPTIVETKVSVVQRIIDAVDMDRDAEFYPIVIEDGSLRMDVGEEERGYARGNLHASSVEGPDAESYYFDGFNEIFDTLSGQVTIQTAPSPNGAPLAVVQSEDHGKTIRHVNGTVNEQ